MAMGIYEPNCEFADPFVSFKGLKRFKQNVSNLGSFMEESSLKVTDWQEFEVCSDPFSSRKESHKVLSI